MAEWRWAAAVVAASVLAVGIAAAVTTSSGAKTLDGPETEAVLRQLPYRFRFHGVPTPDGASGAIAGRAIGPGDVALRFGVSLGGAGDAVSLGPHTDVADATGGETFRLSDDTMIVVDGKPREPARFSTVARWRTAMRMAVAIEEKLCRATEGGACPI
jgi:hypothetical protein